MYPFKQYVYSYIFTCDILAELVVIVPKFEY